jgi:uncharacterized membrane protein YeiB
MLTATILSFMNCWQRRFRTGPMEHATLPCVYMGLSGLLSLRERMS